MPALDWNEHIAPMYRRAGEIFEHLSEDILEGTPALIALLFSGGYDSLASTRVAEEVIKCMQARTCFPGPLCTIVHINTGIGIPQTREYVRRIAHAYYGEDRYLEYTTPESYENIVLTHGFPGPASHRWMYIRLKERALAILKRDHTLHVDKQVLSEILKALPSFSVPAQMLLLHQIVDTMARIQRSKRSPIIYVTGVRLQESTRRMGHVTAIQQHGREIWVSPLLDASKEDVLNLRDYYHMQHNPVVDTTHKSGECLCGAFAHAGELGEIDLWYPEVGCYLRDLERRVALAGFPWRWENGPPASWKQQRQGQLTLWEEEAILAREDMPPTGGFFPLCSSCTNRHEAEKESHVG